MKYLIVLAIFVFLGCSLADGRIIKSSVTKREVKQELLVMVNNLLKKANETITKLAKQNQTSEIELIKNEEANLQKLVKEMQTEKNATKLIQIDHEFTIAYSTLSYNLHRLELAAVDQKALLLERATTLEKQAETLIKKLKVEKKDSDVAILEREEVRIKQLISDLGTVKTPTGITLIESAIKSAEDRLADQLKKILFHEFEIESQRKSLLQRAERLETQAATAIKKLKEDKKDTDVATLEKEVVVVKDLSKKLAAALTETEIYKIEHDLQIAEDKLYTELKRFAALIEPLDSAHKQQLIQKATALEKQAEETIKKLKALKKDNDAAVLEKDEALLKKLVIDLNAAKTDASVKQIEREIETLETRLAAEIKKLTP